MSVILIVEDELSISNLVSVNLFKRGHQVMEARNGEQALEHLYAHDFALMILDMKLPDLSGWEILDHLNSIPSADANFPVLVMTAGVIDMDFVFSKYPCVVDIFIKPFDMARLVTSVQHTLAKH
jgi:two-component system response regulator AdeR